jgi:hypothetical protein
MLFAQQNLYTGQWSWTAKKQKMCMWRGLIYVVQGKGKGYPVIGYEGPEVE